MDEEIVNYPYETASVNFTVAADGIYYVAFRAFSDPDQFYLSLDNIRFTKAILATDEEKSSAISYYPNPAKNNLTVENSQELTNITIYDLAGKVVLKQDANSKNVKLDVSKLAKGVYMMRAATKEGAKTVKIIKD
ncbi:MAG: T9SS type A sorting domain-containing protein [Chryseobacterium sp.]|nr:MAG: T9SS type A sorting domain-containing protein [Chryseobacterium sp.]